MCGGSAPEQKPSAQEIAFAKQAGVQSQFHAQHGLPLEAQEIDQWQDPAIRQMNRELIAGRANADVAAAEQEARAGLRQAAFQSGIGLSSGQNVGQLGDINSAVAEGVGMADVEGMRASRGIHDAEGIGIARTGQDIARSTLSSMASLARAENFKASEKVRAKTLENQARMDMLGTLATGAFGGLSARADRRRWDKFSQDMESAYRNRQDIRRGDGVPEPGRSFIDPSTGLRGHVS